MNLLRPIYPIFFLLCTVNVTNAQPEKTSGTIVIEDNPGGIVETRDLRKAENIKGSIYIHDFWNTGTVLFTNDRILKNVPLKYNLKNEYLHIRDDNNEIRVLRHQDIKQFTWLSSHQNKKESFINLSVFYSKKLPLTGIAEILAEGEMDLLLFRHLTIQKRNYSLIHDLGQRHDEFIIEEEFYVIEGDRFFRIRNRKSLYSALKDKADEVKKFIKANKLKVKKSEDLKEIITYYNGL